MMKSFLRMLLTEDTGSVSVEYVLIAMAIAVGLIPLIDETAGLAGQLYAPLPGLFDAVTD